MKLAGIIFLIATIVYFLIKWKKTGNIKSETNKTSTKKWDEKKKTDDNASGTGYWKKNRKSLIIWAIVLQFIVLNLIYPGEWFEVKKIFWFFAPRISGKYLALKEYKDIIETDKKKKLSDIQEKIRKFEQAKNLSAYDIKKLNDLTKQAEKINDVYTETKVAKPSSAKPKEEVWIFAWRATDELMTENNHQKPSSEYVANDVAYSEKELSFVCFKGSKKEDKIVLTRNNQDENYMGYLFNKEKKEYTRIWLYPDNNNYKGYIFAHNGPKILATLKRQNH